MAGLIEREKALPNQVVCRSDLLDFLVDFKEHVAAETLWKRSNQLRSKMKFGMEQRAAQTERVPALALVHDDALPEVRPLRGGSQGEHDFGVLPRECAVGTKTSSKGSKESWIGTRFEIDAAGSQLPISCVLASASLA